MGQEEGSSEKRMQRYNVFCILLFFVIKFILIICIVLLNSVSNFRNRVLANHKKGLVIRNWHQNECTLNFFVYEFASRCFEFNLLIDHRVLQWGNAITDCRCISIRCVVEII